MSDWTFKDLKKWDEKIVEIAHNYGLDWHPITYEICDYYEMIGHMSYHGLPSHYSHWSYGKSFERTHQMYNMGMEGLPYELIINSNPAIAYLMRQNDLYLQILIMAHCTGHSDFFKNNRHFNKTFPDSVVSKFRAAKKRIQGYIEDPNIGPQQVEDFLDTLHCIRFQTERNGKKRVARDEKIQKYIDRINRGDKLIDVNFDLDREVIEPDSDLLGFLIEHGRHFKDWEIDILNIVQDESHYFIPQLKTKILNEGWASFFHYKILHDLELPQSLHIPFIKSHNQVVRPHIGGVNPYHIGFYLFKKIEEKSGLDECFFIREIHDDESAIRCYFDIDDFRALNIFSYSRKKDHLVIDDVADEPGWKKVRNDFIRNTGINGIPSICVDDISDSGDLILRHVHDGRDVDLEHADNVLNSLSKIWPKEVKFFTVIEDEPWEI
jgi:stage V sporulation protein R